ncbi:membrane protein [Rhodococcoides trifolii]|uniref:Membrane protein n=1 Tax=Rhodococcoides trifolii TaxID=908250 RepID=A0A917CSC8_9NOCA|nr:DUF1304 domain-containing protein [Rhodococcus trifolii]GGF94829.1 membrane protein [Rhodococcus trifolii]
MTTIGLVFAALAALVHVYIFVLEAFLITKPAGMKTFGVKAEDAQTVKQWAFNQGFYNLFLAIGTAAGVVVHASGSHTVGSTLIYFGTGSMLAAGTLLAVTDRRLIRGASVQAVPALLAILFLLGGGS